MLNYKLKKETSSDLGLKALGDDKKNKYTLKKIEDLHKNKQEKILILKDVQKYMSSIENIPEEFITSIENININIKAYEESIGSLELCIPLGLTIAGVSIVSDVLVRRSKDKKIDKEIEKSIATIFYI